MQAYQFYYVSLSDGDSSLRIRFIDARPAESGYYISQKLLNNITPFSSLIFVISGSGSINGNPFSKGQAFYISTDIDYVTSVNDENNTIFFSFAFDGIAHKKLMSDLKLNPGIPTAPIDSHKFEQLVDIYNELRDSYPQNVPADPPQMLSQITAKHYFYTALHCIESKNNVFIDTSRRKLLVCAEEYMRNHFPEEISIEQISEYLSIDRRYLYKLFKNHSGISPKQYLNNIRITRASELLFNSTLSIAEIAEAVGYKDALQFSSFFKKQTGCSPRLYRNRLMNNQPADF